MDKKQDKRLSHLLTLGQQGDQRAYESFLTEVSTLLRSFLLSRTRCPREMEDILQETLLALHRARHSYSPGRPVGPWIYAICKNRLIDGVRKRRRAERIKEAWLKEAEAPASVVADQDSRADQIQDLMNKLPTRQKNIIELLKLRNLSVAEVATQFGMTESAVKVAAFRGYETIRKFFKVDKQ